MSAQPQQNKKNKKDERGGRGRGKERRRNRMHVMAGVHRGVGLGLSLVSPGLKSFLVGMGGEGFCRPNIAAWPPYVRIQILT